MVWVESWKHIMTSGDLRVQYNCLRVEYKCPRGIGKEVGGERIWGKEEPGKSSLSLVGAELQMSQQGLSSSVLDAGQWQTQETWHLAPPPPTTHSCWPTVCHLFYTVSSLSNTDVSDSFSFPLHTQQFLLYSRSSINVEWMNRTRK